VTGSFERILIVVLFVETAFAARGSCGGRYLDVAPLPFR
jgi:hypothetical protein